MAWSRRNKPRARQGKKLPEGKRTRIMNRDRNRGCWFKFPGICVGWSARIEVHHLVEVEDGGTDDDDNLVAVCKPCHTHFSAQQSQRRAVAAANDWKRRPEPHPGVLRDDEV